MLTSKNPISQVETSPLQVPNISISPRNATPTSIANSANQSSQNPEPQSQFNTPEATTNVAPTFSTTTIPRFLPFQCSVRVRETSQQPSPSTRAIRVDISVVGTRVDGVFVEARAGTSRDRQVLVLNKDNSATTQMVVPIGIDAIVYVYASSDLSPESVMCSART